MTGCEIVANEFVFTLNQQYLSNVIPTQKARHIPSTTNSGATDEPHFKQKCLYANIDQLLAKTHYSKTYIMF